MVRLARSSAILLALAITTACGTNASTGVRTYEGPDRHEPAPDSATTTPVRAVRAPAFTVTTLDGETVAVPDARGPTILFFMASWCLSCLRATAQLDDLHRTYAHRGLRVLVLDVDPTDRPADVARFRELAGEPRYFWALDDGQRIARAYQVRSLDATVLIDPGGEVRFRSESLPDFEALRGAVRLVVGQ